MQANYTENLKLPAAYDAVAEEKFLISKSTSEWRRKRKSMKVLMRRNRPSTKQWTGANAGGDEVVLRILPRCIPERKKTSSRSEAAVWI